MLNFERADLKTLAADCGGLAVYLLAEKGIGYSQTPMAGTDGDNGWFDCISSYFRMDGEIYYMIAAYHDSNGFEGGFESLQKVYPVPAHEIRRGRMPAHHMVIEGKRYYKPDHGDA